MGKAQEKVQDRVASKSDRSQNQQSGRKMQLPAKRLSAESLSRITGQWLQWQCGLLNNVQYGLVIDSDAVQSNGVVSAGSAIAQTAGMHNSVQLKKPLHKPHEQIDNNCGYWQVPVRCVGRELCVVLHVDSIAEPQGAAVQRLLRWGVLILRNWLEDAQHGSSTSAPPLKSMLSKTNLTQAAACWVDDLQARTGANRVSVAWTSDTKTQLLAVSGVLTLDARRALPRCLTAALNECMEHSLDLSYPDHAAGATRSTAQACATGLTSECAQTYCEAHQRLHEQYGQHQLFSLPLVQDENALGAVLLEFDNTQKVRFSPYILRDEVSLVAPVFAMLSERKPGAGWFLRSRLRRSLRTFTQPQTRVQRTISWLALAVVLVALFFPFSQRISIQGEIQGADRQVLAATHEAYLSKASARAGDVVSTGQVLANFDDAQLQLERDTWVSELTRIDSALVQAMAARDLAAIGRLRAEQSAANAELELIDHQLHRSAIIAPFDGVLVSGDLDDRLGSIVRAGESLFQIASLDDYQLQLDVPEHQAALVGQGAQGTMRFAAFPSLAFNITVQSMVPVAVLDNSENVFRMRATLIGDTEAIRPGMSGVAKVLVGKRSWLLRASDVITQRLRFWWWSIGT